MGGVLQPSPESCKNLPQGFHGNLFGDNVPHLLIIKKQFTCLILDADAHGDGTGDLSFHPQGKSDQGP